MTKYQSRGHKQGTRGASDAGGAAPVLKLRQLIVGIACVVIVIAWPMFMVWKQINITNISLKESSLSDSLTVLSKQIATLRLYNEKLAAIQRIEAIARTSLSLEYPTSEQIVVVRETRTDPAPSAPRGGFLAFLRKTFSQGRG